MAKVLIVDADPAQARVLTRALRQRGLEVVSTRAAEAALRAAARCAPDLVVIEQFLAGECGLALIRPLRAINPATRILVLTASPSIAAAVAAIKAGACNYLAKPAYVDELLAAADLRLDSAQATQPPLPRVAAAPRIHSLQELERQHLRRTLADHHGNVAATARALHMHRKTLQRKLAQQQLTAAARPRRPAPRLTPVLP